MSVDGKWNLTMTTPRGSRDVTIDFVVAGSDLSGTWTGPQGSQEFSGGTVAGNDLDWTVKRSGAMGEMTLAFKAKVDGDKISGTVQLGQMGSGTFEGSRA